jgi:HemY protein
MLRLVLFLLSISALAFGLAWLADQPSRVVIEWPGYSVESSALAAVVVLALLIGLCVVLWAALRQIWLSPAAIGGFFNRRRQKRGLDALSSGMIAIGAGDRSLATRYALQARKALPNEPLTHLLRAQAAQLSGDRPTARRIFEAMLASPDTEQLGLRGLFLEAEKEGEREAARQFAERALGLNPKLAWPVEALFDIQCKSGDWAGALETLGIASRHHHVERPAAERRRAVLLTAQAQAAEETDPDRALTLALEAHGLAPDLVPAAAIAGRVLAARGNTPKATRVLQRTWKRSPHPDLATAYAYARIGDSPQDRLARIEQLGALRPMSIESPIAVATAAIEARAWDVARHALEPLLESRLTQRVCTLMAQIEGKQHGDAGRVREWLARAVNAPRDPAWTADGIVADEWAPVSPVTGALDAFQWRVPVEALEKPDAELLGRKVEELVELGARQEKAIAATPIEVAPVPVPAEPPAVSAAPPMPAKTETSATAPPLPEPAPAPSQPSRPTETPVKVPSTPAEVAPPVKEAAKASAPPLKGEAAETARSVPSGAGKKAAETRTQRPPEKTKKPPRMFVPPRAPDDPGTEEEAGAAEPLPGAYHLPIKGSA